MSNLINFFLLIITIFPLFGCQKLNKSDSQIDNKSYINNFELLQDNPNNQTTIKITSPKAIIDLRNNDIEIFESTIELINKNVQDLIVKSGKASLNNLYNSIRVFNSVNLSFYNNRNYNISTNSLYWDLNTSIIDIKNPLKLNSDNTEINATSGFYNIDSRLLKIENSDFKRSYYNSEGEEDYQINIKSEFAKWLKKDNILLFKSNDKQVETIINFLISE